MENLKLLRPELKLKKETNTVVYVVTWLPTAEVVKSEEKSIARQLLGKHIQVATNAQTIIE
jgi:hypothetical protein